MTLLCDRTCELGEGPSFDPSTQTLWWLDIAGRQLLSRRLKGEATVAADLPFTASAVARVDAATQMLATDRGLFLRDVRSGRLSLHAASGAERAELRSNDARVHPCGALWFGTMGRKAERGAGAIWHHAGGRFRKLYDAISIPNAICFSPEGDVAWFADSLDNRMMRVACDPATGLPGGEPEVFFDNRGDKGALDGSVCDGDGVIWNARWGAGSLDAYSPQGKRIRSIALPVRQPTCPASIGGGRLAVTSAWEGMDAARRAGDPEAGMTFIVEAGCADRFEPDAGL
jgi:sugar lactone lactonase YvrE